MFPMTIAIFMEFLKTAKTIKRAPAKSLQPPPPLLNHGWLYLIQIQQCLRVANTAPGGKAGAPCLLSSSILSLTAQGILLLWSSWDRWAGRPPSVSPIRDMSEQLQLQLQIGFNILQNINKIYATCQC